MRRSEGEQGGTDLAIVVQLLSRLAEALGSGRVDAGRLGERRRAGLGCNSNGSSWSAIRRLRVLGVRRRAESSCRFDGPDLAS